MSNKLITFLLLLNLTAILVVGYTLCTKDSGSQALEVKEDYEKFKAKVYQGLALLMSGQQRLDTDILRVHHFVSPHADRFYKDCPECQQSLQKTLDEEKEKIISIKY
jgi:hypothetical protein|tara:strand:- start:2562 stop:2882 length:321 start_codon:yes stop_codon:yes gene_type:complete